MPENDDLSHQSLFTSSTASQLVMVIDDSQTVRKILETTLQREGYEVHAFSNGLDALALLASSEMLRPSVIFVDLCMPKMDGYEVLLQLKQVPMCSQTTFILMSRRDGLVDKLKGRLAGAHEYLVKPVRTETLLGIVQKYTAPSLSLPLS